MNLTHGQRRVIVGLMLLVRFFILSILLMLNWNDVKLTRVIWCFKSYMFCHQKRKLNFLSCIKCNFILKMTLSIFLNFNSIYNFNKMKLNALKAISEYFRRSLNLVKYYLFLLDYKYIFSTSQNNKNVTF